MKLNYRNTFEILSAAHAILGSCKEQIIEYEATEMEIIEPEFATRHGPKPELHVTAHFEQCARVLAQEWLSHRPGSAPLAILIPDESERFLATLKTKFKWPPLSKLNFWEPATIYVDSFTHSKGLEFGCVIIIDPSPTRGQEIVERWRRQLRLYVAMTRAKEQLYAVAAPDSFLADAIKNESESFLLINHEAEYSGGVSLSHARREF